MKARQLLMLLSFCNTLAGRTGNTGGERRIYHGQIDPPGSPSFPYQLQIVEISPDRKLTLSICGATLISQRCESQFSGGGPTKKCIRRVFSVSTTPLTDCPSQYPFLGPKKDHFDPFFPNFSCKKTTRRGVCLRCLDEYFCDKKTGLTTDPF